MSTNIDLEAVKQYNSKLEQYKSTAAKLQAEIDFSVAEMTRLCESLTTELGVQVTPDNIEMIYQEHLDKLNKALEIGNDIFQRIKNEEERASQNKQMEAQMNNLRNSAASTINPAPNPGVITPGPVTTGASAGSPFNGGFDTLPSSMPNVQAAPLGTGVGAPPPVDFGNLGDIPPMFGKN